jgi:hypothetical protein
MSDPFDIEEGASAPSDSSTMQRMMRMAAEIIETEETVEALEENLADLKRRLNHLKTIELPDLMAENGLSSFTHSDSGRVIEVSDFVAGSLTKKEEDRKAALDWLAQNGAAEMIKSEISVAFGKTEHNMAKDLAAKLKDEGYFVEESEGIHAQTLLAFVREKMRNGEEVPLEMLGLYAGRVAKVKASRKRGK